MILFEFLYQHHIRKQWLKNRTVLHGISN